MKLYLTKTRFLVQKQCFKPFLGKGKMEMSAIKGGGVLPLMTDAINVFFLISF